MFERIVAPRPRLPAESTSPLVASVAFHVVLATLAMGVLAHATRTTAVHDAAEHAAEMLLPLLPSSAPPEETALTWEGGTTAGNGPAAPRAGAGSGLGIRRGSGRMRSRTVPGTEAGLSEGGGVQPVYAFDAQLDRPVERHPTAGAPDYPADLLARRIEGYVVAEFTVLPDGRADSASLVIAQVSHPGFAEALRAAMPRLRFIPAEHQGRRVSQRVQQRYIFRVEVTDTTRT